jgi:CysZ protein
MLADFIDGILSYLRALAVLRKYNLGRYFVITGVGSLIIGVIVMSVIYGNYDEVGALISNAWPWEWGAEWVSKIAGGLSFAVMALLFLIIYKYLIFILLAPIMSLVSQRVENHEKGGIHNSGINVIGEMIRGVRIALRNILRELFFTIILLIASLILPIFSWLTSVLILIIQAYYAGFGNMDYTLERYYNTHQSVVFIRENRGFAVGNGLVFLLLLAVPVLGIFLAPFLGAVGATLGTLNRLESSVHSN